MFRKSILSLVFAAGFLFAAQHMVYSQTGPVNGTVQLAKADGTKEPVAGALIEVYRTDIKAGFPSAKTNKKGQFNFAGMLYGALFTLSISAPGCSPQIYPAVKAGQEGIVIMLSPGDGRKLSEAEARQGAATAAKGGGELAVDDAEQKKAQAEYERKNAEITAKNSRLKEGDDTARRANEEGNAALKAGNYDLAVSKYSEGVAAVPDFVGSTPILLSGKINALKLKGHKAYEEGARSPDVELRKSKYVEANASYDQALAAFQNAVDILKHADAATDPAEKKRREVQMLDLYTSAIELHRLKAATHDSSKAGDANTVITEYLTIETDPAKKLAAQMTLGDIMRYSGDLEKAVAAYRLALAASPDNSDATGKLGVSLYGLGASTEPENKEIEQEGLNYMQKYIDMAPVAATDSAADKDFKLSVKQTVEYLKEQKMAPQKTPGAKVVTKKKS